jgi:uncharacterized protein
MLSECMKADRGFVVVLIKGEEKEGEEVGGECEFYRIGTYVNLIDFQKLESGLLGITVEGETKVLITGYSQGLDGLYFGDIQHLMHEEYMELPDEYLELATLLEQLAKHPVVKALNMDVDYLDGRHVGWRLTELLPFDKKEKQFLLALTDPLERLKQIDFLLSLMES